MTRRTATAGPILHVGQHARFEFGGRAVRVTVLEDRGPLGVNGTQVYRIEIPLDEHDSIEGETGADLLTPLPVGS